MLSMAEGTVRQRKDGSWEARLLIPREMRGAFGKIYLYFYAKKKTDVLRKRNEARTKLFSEGPASLTLERITFGAWLARWLSGPLQSTVPEGTYRFYKDRAERYLIPALGHMRLQDLTAEHLDDLYAKLSRGEKPATRPLSPVTIGHVHSTAHAALSRAAKKGVIRQNPAQYAEPPSVKKKERPVIGKDDLSRFFAAAAGERLEALWIVWILTGLRPGEILGLKWGDVREDELLIRCSYSATQNGAYMRETMKTGKG